MSIVMCSGCGDCYGSIDEMYIIGGRPYCYSCYKKSLDPSVGSTRQVTCPNCKGDGATDDGVCYKCGGMGWIYAYEL